MYWGNVYSACSCGKTFLWVMHKSLSSWIQTVGDKRGDTFGAHHICFLWVPRTCSLRSFQPVAM